MDMCFDIPIERILFRGQHVLDQDRYFVELHDLLGLENRIRVAIGGTSRRLAPQSQKNRPEARCGAVRVPEVDCTIDRPRVGGSEVVTAVEEPAFPVPAIPATMRGETSIRRASVKLREVAPTRGHGFDHRRAAIRPVGVKVQEDVVGHGTEGSSGVIGSLQKRSFTAGFVGAVLSFIGSGNGKPPRNSVEYGRPFSRVPGTRDIGRARCPPSRWLAITVRGRRERPLLGSHTHRRRNRRPSLASIPVPARPMDIRPSWRRWARRRSTPRGCHARDRRRSGSHP